MKQIGTLKDYVPKYDQKKDLMACDEQTLHGILGGLLFVEKETEQLLHETMRAKARVFRALYEKGAFSYEKLALLDKDNMEVNKI